MLKPKRVPYRNQKIRDAANGEECTICGTQDGTTVFAHLNESWAGKGMGQKADDCAGIFACATCHQEMDSYNVESWLIFRGYYRTIRRLLDMGVLK